MYITSNKPSDKNKFFEGNINNLMIILTTFININFLNINDTVKTKFFKDFEELALESEYLIKLDKNNKEYQYNYILK